VLFRSGGNVFINEDNEWEHCQGWLAEEIFTDREWQSCVHITCYGDIG
jgi:hypothetical protein